MAKKRAYTVYKEAPPALPPSVELRMEPLEHFAKFIEDAERLFGECKVKVTSVQEAV